MLLMFLRFPIHLGCVTKHTLSVIHAVLSNGVEESAAFISLSNTCCPERACRTLIKILAKVDQEINTHESTVHLVHRVLYISNGVAKNTSYLRSSRKRGEKGIPSL